MVEECLSGGLGHEGKTMFLKVLVPKFKVNNSSVEDEERRGWQLTEQEQKETVKPN